MSPDPTRPAERISIAIVDDEESVRIGLRRLCSAIGLNPTIYASGRELIDSLEAGAARPDCLLLDAHMPQMTGLELHQHLVHIGVTLPTIVYTADDAPEAQARYIAAGVTEYLRKPIGGDDLFAVIERAVIARRGCAR